MSTKPISITINNITERDAESNLIRIIKDHKYLFPSEKPGEPQSFTLPARINGEDYDVTYRIGSHDGKERSGRLMLGVELYRDILKLKKNSKLKISKSNGDVYYISKI